MINKNPEQFQEKINDCMKLMSQFVESLRKDNAMEVQNFLDAELELLRGPHFDEDSARALVKTMDPNGEKEEFISIDEVKEALPEEFHEKQLWDAYVGINEMLRLLNETSLEREQIIEVAITFWLKDNFHYADGEKVWRVMH